MNNNMYIDYVREGHWLFKMCHFSQWKLFTRLCGYIYAYQTIKQKNLCDFTLIEKIEYRVIIEYLILRKKTNNLNEKELTGVNEEFAPMIKIKEYRRAENKRGFLMQVVQIR